MLTLDDAKEQLVTVMRRALQDGLVHATAGNASCRLDDGNVAVTPTSIRYDTMTPEDIVIVSPAGKVVAGHRKPSTETALHLAILNRYTEFHAALHCHATHASMFAVTGTPLPNAIEEFGIYVGGDVRVADYEITGSDELAEQVAAHLADRSAVLMANHGLAVAAASPHQALDLAALVEHTARIVWGARQLGEIVPLPAAADERLRSVYELVRGRPG